MKAVDLVVIRAEQALLGAVMSDPAGQAHVLDLVDPDDMTRPYHGQVLAAMQRLRGSGIAPGPLAVYAEIKKDPDLPRSVSHDGVLLAELMEAAPRPGHASAYAAIVAGNGIRRRIALVASRMIQAAEGQDLETALLMAGQARRELGRCQARWDALPKPMRRKQPAEDVAESGSDLRWRQAQAGTAAGVCTGPADADEAGARVLRDLLAGSSQISAVSAWLRPEDFSRAGHGELYEIMRDIADAGQPVDPVTVSWAASRRGIDADAADLTGGMAPFAVASAREVHRRGLLARIARAGRDIQATAEDQRSAPVVLRVAGERLRSIELDRRPGAWQVARSAPRTGLGTG